MVKCGECGFLTYRHPQPLVLHEPDEEYGNTGKPVHVEPRDASCYPVCFAQALDFRNELEAQVLRRDPAGKGEAIAPSTHPTPGAFVEAFIYDRPCNEFTPWQFGFTPKEHREILDRTRLLELERKHEKSRRKFEECLTDRSVGPQKWLVAIAIGGVVIGLLSAGTQVIQAFRDNPPNSRNEIRLPAETPTPSP